MILSDSCLGSALLLLAVKTLSGKRSLAPQVKKNLMFNQATLHSDASISSSRFTPVNNCVSQLQLN